MLLIISNDQNINMEKRKIQVNILVHFWKHDNDNNQSKIYAILQRCVHDARNLHISMWKWKGESNVIDYWVILISSKAMSF